MGRFDTMSKIGERWVKSTDYRGRTNYQAWVGNSVVAQIKDVSQDKSPYTGGKAFPKKYAVVAFYNNGEMSPFRYADTVPEAKELAIRMRTNANYSKIGSKTFAGSVKSSKNVAKKTKVISRSQLRLTTTGKSKKY